MSTTALGLHPVPSFEMVVDRNAIAELRAPGDLTVRGGDIAVTRWGDLMLNDEIYSALVRFVQFWRHNYPTLHMLFDLVVASFKEEEGAKVALESLGSMAWQREQGPVGGMDVTAFHLANERIGATLESRGILAGTILLVVGRALATLREDLRVTREDWRTVDPLRGAVA